MNSLQFAAIEDVSLADLAARIVARERVFGVSSIELLRRYVCGEIPDHDDAIEDWLDELFLFLSDERVRRYAT